MRIARITLPLVAAMLFIAGCASQKEPAEQAVSKVEAALAEVRADAEKYAADDLKSVDDQVNSLKKKIADQDYGAALIAAPSVSSAVAQLKSKAEQAKADAEATLAAAQTEWTDLSSKVPPLIEKLQARVDSLVKTKKFPKGMDKAAFETAKTDFETLKTRWTEAGSEFASGQAGNAVRKAREAKARAEDLMTKLEAQG
jgi:hypothetical protein